MNWQVQLITIYLYVCKQYEESLWVYGARHSNYVNLRFTDEEAITLYLFGILDKRREIKQIYTYADRHLRDWFPELPSYVAFVQRLNQLCDVFAPLVETIQTDQKDANASSALLVDSFPVALARQGHRFRACVAKELADHGYCATKKLYFYGVRVHVVGRRRAGTLPTPEYIGVAPASHPDGKVFDLLRPVLGGEEVYGDKAYQATDAVQPPCDPAMTMRTPVKKQKGQKYLDADEQWLSTAVSCVRQPIETLFGWIEEKTGIELAGRVRSYKGLMVHIFGRLAAALFFWRFLRV